MHQGAMDICRRFVKNHLAKQSPGSILDAGGRNVREGGTFRDTVPKSWNYTAVDLVAGDRVDIVVQEPYFWREVPIAEYDVVVSTNTLEHIPKPWLFAVECVRHLKPGGLLFIVAPNTWRFHENPVDCWRVWPDGMRGLFDYAGLKTLEADYVERDTWGVGRKEY